MKQGKRWLVRCCQQRKEFRWCSGCLGWHGWLVELAEQPRPRIETGLQSTDLPFRMGQ